MHTTVPMAHEEFYFLISYAYILNTSFEVIFSYYMGRRHK